MSAPQRPILVHKGRQRCTPRRWRRFESLATGLALALTIVLGPGPGLEFGSVPAHANVFGLDDRRPLSPDDGISAAGTIVCEGTTRRPSAALVTLPGMDPERRFDLVITVAHTFRGRHDAYYENCQFEAYDARIAPAPIVRVLLGTETPHRQWSHDWAVAVLDRRISSKLTPLIPRVVRESELDALKAAGAHFALVGHEGERGPLSISSDCGPRLKQRSDFRPFDRDTFHHDCDMGPGWSGGPLVMLLDGEAYVIAVNATSVNGIVSVEGDAYDGSFNPNTAVRLDGRFFAALRRLALPMHAAASPASGVSAYSAGARP